jgi:hypothetical protein
MQTEQRLNEVFLRGKAQELGLQEAVAEAARRAAGLALKHDISTEEMTLALDAAKGEREATALRRALQNKVLVADFTRTEAVTGAQAAAAVRTIALGTRAAEAKVDQEIARRQAEVDQYAEELTAKREREKADDDQKREERQDQHDLELLKELREMKQAKAALEQQHRLERARLAGQQVIAEKEVEIAEKEVDAAVEMKALETDQAKVLAEADAKVKVAVAKYAAKGQKYSAKAERAEAALRERDRSDAERRDRDEIERDRRDGEADRLERVMMAALDSKQASAAQAAAAGQQHSAELLTSERRQKGEMRADFRESADRLAGVATHKVDPGVGGGAAGSRGVPPVSVHVEVGGSKCPDCGPVKAPDHECPYCGAALA